MLKPKALSCIKLLSWQMSSKITEVLLDNHTLNFQIFIVTNWKFDILLVFNTGPRPEC
jgi:hypothetical protein